MMNHRLSDRAVMAAGALSAGLGLVVLVGWYTHNVTLIQVLPAFVPMQYNTALGFVLCGAGLLLIAFGRPRAAMACGAAAGAIGVVTLTEYIFGVNLGIDQLLMEHYITIKTSHPGRMAPNTAVCFGLTGAFLFAIGTGVWHRRRPPIWGLLGLIIVALGAVALFGYVSGVETAYGWGHLTRMAVHTAAGCLLLGTGVLVLAWREGTDQEAGTPRWVPLLVAVGGVAVSALLWQALTAQERAQIGLRTESEALHLRNEITGFLKPPTLAVVRMANRWAVRGKPPREEWESDAGSYVRDVAALDAVEWVAPSFQVRWAVPLAGNNEADQDVDVVLQWRRQTAMEVTRDRGEVTVTPPINLAQGGKGFMVCAPILSGEDFGGYIGGVFDVEEMFEAILGESVTLRGYSIAVFAGEEELYGRDNISGQPEAQWMREVNVDLYGATWRVQIWPGPEILATARTVLPEVVLAAGVLAALLLTLAVHLGQTSLLRAREIASVNQELEAEVTERKRAEATFRGLLETAPDAMVIINNKRQIVLANAQTEHLFGYVRQELLGQPVEMLVPQRFRSQHPAHVADYFANPQLQSLGADRDLYGRRKDGKVFPIEIRLGPLETEEGVLVSSAIRDITERKKAEDLLNQTLAGLERSNAELELFAYVASHDLQEPLRMVASYLQLLERKYNDKLDADAKQFIGFAVDGATRMKRLINDLLVYSRVGTRGRGFEVTDCQTILDQALADLEVVIEKSGAEISQDPLPTVSADASQLGQVFQNLVNNAIKFRSDRPPQVHVGAQRDNGEWVFSVRDNGIGIEPEFAERIFVIFQRLHGQEEYSGTGIGLAVCKKIVERHGGRIWVESQPGNGSTFYFTFPQRQETDSHDEQTDQQTSRDPVGRRQPG